MPLPDCSIDDVEVDFFLSIHVTSHACGSCRCVGDPNEGNSSKRKFHVDHRLAYSACWNIDLSADLVE